MAKIKLSRDHNGNEAGKEVDIPNEQLEYFERTGLAVKEEKQAYNNKEQKAKYKTK